MTDTTTAAVLDAKREFLDMSKQEQLAFIAWAEANKDATADRESKTS